jgi:hypothetical protein
MRRLLILVITVQAIAAVAGAQSLGDVAKQEEARRKAVKSTGKVYTNDNLRPDPSTPASPSAAAEPAATDSAAAAGASTDKGSAAGSDKSSEPKKDEAYWRDRVKSERDALGRAQLFAESLQSRINALTADFSARDDPYQRNQVSQDRAKALAELDRVRKEIADHTKAIADIQDAARKAGVPAGWVR